jgi:predicted ATPase
MHPGCNLILGKNGCGKSNFLQGNSLYDCSHRFCAFRCV